MKKEIKETSAGEMEVKQTPEIQLPSLQDLLSAGSHFGHKASTWNPKMKPYIYEERNGVHIIDLIKSLGCMKTALGAIQKAAGEGNILIVGTKGQAATMVAQLALQKGAFYVNKRWPGGLFTNFKGVRKSIEKLVKMEQILASGAKGMVKKEELLMRRDVERLNLVYEGLKFMDRLPVLVIVIDSKVEKNAIRECRNMNIPVVALMDTNCDPSVVTYPIPANDDSLKSISLFVELFGKALDGSKYSKDLIAKRTVHVTSLENEKAMFEAEIERKRAMEEEEKARIKALRQGTVQTESKVVRVVEKQVTNKLEDSSLSARTVKALNEAGLSTVEELKTKTKEEISEIKGIGAKALDEVLGLIK